MQTCRPKTLHDNVSRRKDASPIGRAVFIGLRAVDAWWQYRFLSLGWAAQAIERLGGQSVPTNQIFTTTNITGLQPYYGLVSLLALGSSVKQIATMIIVSEQETPVSSGITIAAFNTIFNTVNTLLSVWAMTSQVPSPPSFKPVTRLLIRNHSYCHWRVHTLLGSSQRQSLNFSGQPSRRIPRTRASHMAVDYSLSRRTSITVAIRSGARGTHSSLGDSPWQLLRSLSSFMISRPAGFLCWTTT